ncbi:class I SAM-dependent methyltransferase [Salinisphaera sp.]|uniref:class I SAM-dependent methyltransferase n=1 Tax=Salinisphaera sp. TaxID=1914330 RepID=UPI000C4CA535|nr:class I SAM-dependent methyltransferase [Salinisphaera sp.]MBS63503.1 hypothetical protein [Salinisphaera sp.]
MKDTAPHAYFEADWLSLREVADHQARATLLTDAASRWLAQRMSNEHHIVDLGAGRGSNLRYLAPRLTRSQRWRLIDHDPDLLRAVKREEAGLVDTAGMPITLETETLDLNAARFEAGLDGADLVTASALFDLVTREWIERLARACAARSAAVLFVLSIDGTIDFAPTGEDDDFVTDLLAAHQRRDKSFGTALGAEAPAVLRKAFEAQGYDVCLANSPWHIDAGNAALGTALIEGWRSAACEQAPKATARIDAWAEARTRALMAGALSITVGHQDFFATPMP